MWLMLPALASCAQWPLHENLPADTGAAVPSGSAVSAQVTWTERESLAAAPGGAEPLALYRGLTASGTLSGAGLTRDATPERTEACDRISDFPPAQHRGEYQGQALWLSLAPATGTLCASARSADGAVGLDLLLFDISRCDLPLGPASDPQTGAALGLGGAARVDWSARVVEGEQLAVVIAANAPDDPAYSAPYELAVALVPRGDDGGDGTCQPPPWELP